MGPQTAYEVKTIVSFTLTGGSKLSLKLLLKARMIGIWNAEEARNALQALDLAADSDLPIPLNEYKEGAFLHSAIACVGCREYSRHSNNISAGSLRRICFRLAFAHSLVTHFPLDPSGLILYLCLSLWEHFVALRLRALSR